MTNAENILDYINRQATKLEMTVEVERTKYGTHFIKVKADDSDIFVVMGKRGGISFVSFKEPINFYCTYKDRKANRMQIGQFFSAVERQRKMISERQAA